MCASTYRKEKPPQPFLGLPRVRWLPEKAMEGSFGGFFSGVVEERHDTPERVRKQTLVEAREARFFFFFNETGTF